MPTQFGRLLPRMSRSHFQSSADSALVDQLVQLVLHWGVGPDRFLTGNRSWIPRWKFDPLRRLADAFRLLDATKASSCTINIKNCSCSVEIKIKANVGTSSGSSRPRAITLAVARSLGLQV
jgi:hypothetical protein